jgi:hypothetical protein
MQSKAIDAPPAGSRHGAPAMPDSPTLSSPIPAGACRPPVRRVRAGRLSVRAPAGFGPGRGAAA